MKVVIVQKPSAEIEKTILAAFPPEWKVVLTGPEGLRAEIADAEALIPEHNTVDEALPEAVHPLRKTIVDSALVLADQLVTTQCELLRSIVRSADRALSKPRDSKD